MVTKPLNTYRVVLPYSESSNPRKRFKIEYTIEAPDREIALQKAEREFFAYTLYNSASWVRVLERENVRVWRLIPDFPQTAQSIDDFANNLRNPDPDIIYNTLRALGDLEDAAIGSPVAALLQHPNPDLAAMAAETLGKLRDITHVPLLLKQFSLEADARLKACILSALTRLARAEDPVFDVLAMALGDEDPRVRANAVEVVEQLKLPTTARMLVPLLEDEDNRVRANVLKALWSTHDRNALAPVLQDMARNPNRWMRASAAFVLQHIQVDNRLELLGELQKDAAPEVVTNARRALLTLDEVAALPHWLDSLVGTQGADWEKISRKIESLGESAFDRLLQLEPRSKEERRFIRLFLDAIEDRIFQGEGWVAWFKLKQRRLFSGRR